MSVVYSQAQKQRYRITLELDVLGDFDPHQISWEDIFDLGGDEQVEAYVEDLSVPVRWCDLDSIDCLSDIVNPPPVIYKHD